MLAKSQNFSSRGEHRKARNLEMGHESILPALLLTSAAFTEKILRGR